MLHLAEDYRWVERYDLTCNVEMAWARVGGHPLFTHVVFCAFSSVTRDTKVGEAVSRGQASGRLGDEITIHLPRSLRVRSQQETRLACGINSEATDGFYHSKYNSSSPRKRLIASKVPWGKSTSRDWRTGFFPVAGRPRTRTIPLRSSRWELLVSDGNSPVGNAGICGAPFTGPVRVHAPWDRRWCFVARRFPAEVTTGIERKARILDLRPAFYRNFGFPESLPPPPSDLRSRSQISVLSSYLRVIRQAIRPGSVAGSSY